jgi:hypothetical protein
MIVAMNRSGDAAILKDQGHRDVRKAAAYEKDPRTKEKPSSTTKKPKL